MLSYPDSLIVFLSLEYFNIHIYEPALFKVILGSFRKVICSNLFHLVASLKQHQNVHLLIIGQ